MVIWDLDCTLWYGTLLEGGYRAIPQNVDLVHRLSEIGIVNSIVSNSDINLARAALSDLGLWEEFILPSIEFSSKGRRVKEIVTAVGLRPEDVLFLDDQPTNCADVQFSLPEIMTSTGDAISDLIAYAWSVEPSPRARTRIQSYKSIAARENARRAYEGPNTDFLHSAALRVSYSPLSPQVFSHVIDLVNRSNQLNYTKSRINFEYLSNLVNSSHNAFCVNAADNFGNHGIVGFVELRDGEAKHFVFSCRVMNLGVERFVFQHLGRPRIEVIEPVSYPLEPSEKIDWVTFLEALDAPVEDGLVSVLAKGGCEIERLVHYIDRRFIVDAQLNYVNDFGFPVHLESIQALRERRSGNYESIADAFVDFDFIDPRLGIVDQLATRPHFMIISLASDYSQGHFQSRSTGAVVPLFKWDDDWDTEEAQDGLIKRYRIQPDQGHGFLRQFRFLGGSTSMHIRDNLLWLTRQSNIARHYLIMNCAEVNDAPAQFASEVARNKTLNSAVDDALQDIGNAKVVDVRTIVESFHECEDNLRHFRPRVYARISEVINTTMISIV
jgi:FkbH-like protein